MAGIGNFFEQFYWPFVWVASGVIFLGFMAGLYQMFSGLWTYFKSLFL